ncbi:MAG: precorrin-2 C(20)-methyltransferase [Thermodesulfobacteriota bacterium]|nr:precorrin-2 C(20)-methyltransferase [Thermodesulfobacteriota bacterium]
MKHKKGKLYGIGVGPGDPELIPLKSVRILKSVGIVFAAASSKNDYSYAMEIARPHLNEDTTVIRLSCPMITDIEKKRQAWQKNAKIVIEYLNQGKNAAFITIGDPLTYSTYSYLVREIQSLSPNTTINTIPGITSYQAAAALANTPLSEGDESLLILSGLKEKDQLKNLSGKVDNIILLKAYRNMEDIYSAIEEIDLVDKTTGVICCGLDGEELVTDIRKMINKKPHYFTVLMIKNTGTTTS